MINPLAPFPGAPTDARYGDREFSQLSFNARLLCNALDEREPLLERVKYLAIFASNTDEWVQKRLERLATSPDHVTDTPKWMRHDRHLSIIHHLLQQNATDLANIFHTILIPRLRDEGIIISNYGDLTAEQRAEIKQVFGDTMFPLLTPLAIDPGRPFPHISTLSTNIAIEVEPTPGQRARARLKVPGNLPRFVAVKPTNPDITAVFVPIEQVIIAHLNLLFPNVPVLRTAVFRVTRHALGEFDEGRSTDLLETIESGILQRRFGRVVRIEIEDNPEDEAMLAPFFDDLGGDEHTVIRVPGLLDLSGLWQIVGLRRQDLKHPDWTPIRSRAIGGREEMWSRMRAGDVLVHHPYEDFDSSTLQFIEQAARDPKVVAIKLTIYRTTAKNSPIVNALIDAAEAGKQVVALVELKARFDEEANIRRARDLESAGVHVVYGLIGLKTHTKTTLVVREEKGILRRYVHIGTGNYNPSTAGIYEDLGIFTTRPDVCSDLSQLFNKLTGYVAEDTYKALLVAPNRMRDEIVERIRAQASLGTSGHIIMKCNNFVDTQLINELYAASQQGVTVQLIVRTMCAILPGRPGLSDNITVRSIIGRFLEHSRIFRFGTPETGMEYLMGSADMMTRNLDRRVEAIIPVVDAVNRARLQEILDVVLQPDVKAWTMDPDGLWRAPTPDMTEDAHEIFQRLALARA
ncbi:polyphosphate kinase 1 [Stomatohabitans albus]|uniref:polyphosphate kinase 1 n=1 Tax=Stomatohabitans albus TaxID=3110766 RepID=UPI00300CC363